MLMVKCITFYKYRWSGLKKNLHGHSGSCHNNATLVSLPTHEAPIRPPVCSFTPSPRCSMQKANRRGGGQSQIIKTHCVSTQLVEMFGGLEEQRSAPFVLANHAFM